LVTQLEGVVALLVGGFKQIPLTNEASDMSCCKI